jgi:hypothetical protein
MGGETRPFLKKGYIMNKSILIILYSFVLLFFSGCKDIVAFTSEDFPIAIGADCASYDEHECEDIEEAIADFNASARVEVFEFVPDSEQIITIDFSDEKISNEESIHGLTEWEDGYISITIRSHMVAPQCVIQHESDSYS